MSRLTFVEKWLTLKRMGPIPYSNRYAYELAKMLESPANMLKGLSIREKKISIGGIEKLSEEQLQKAFDQAVAYRRETYVSLMRWLKQIQQRFFKTGEIDMALRYRFKGVDINDQDLIKSLIAKSNLEIEAAGSPADSEYDEHVLFDFLYDTNRIDSKTFCFIGPLSAIYDILNVGGNTRKYWDDYCKTTRKLNVEHDESPVIISKVSEFMDLYPQVQPGDSIVCI